MLEDGGRTCRADRPETSCIPRGLTLVGCNSSDQVSHWKLTRRSFLSIPGHGFSDPPIAPGFGIRRAADVFDKLMKRLGYSHYITQGGDWSVPPTLSSLDIRMRPNVLAVLLGVRLSLGDWRFGIKRVAEPPS